MNDKEIVAQFLKLQRPEYDRNANVISLLDYLMRVAKPVMVESLNDAVYQLRETLLLAAAYEDAWEDFKFYNPGQTGSAHRIEFIEKMRAKEVQAARTTERDGLLKVLGDKFKNESLERLREVAEKRRIHGLTASQFKEERAAAAPKETRRKQYDGFVSLPDLLVLPGDIQATKITSEFLRGLPRANYSLYRWLCSRFGMNQITDRQREV
jgi:hypothetical protein